MQLRPRVLHNSMIKVIMVEVHSRLYLKVKFLSWALPIGGASIFRKHNAGLFKLLKGNRVKSELRIPFS